MPRDEAPTGGSNELAGAGNLLDDAAAEDGTHSNRARLSVGRRWHGEPTWRQAELHHNPAMFPKPMPLDFALTVQRLNRQGDQFASTVPSPGCNTPARDWSLRAAMTAPWMSMGRPQLLQKAGWGMTDWCRVLQEPRGNDGDSRRRHGSDSRGRNAMDKEPSCAVPTVLQQVY